MPGKVLFITCMQNRMVDGEKGSAGSRAIVPRIADEIARGGYRLCFLLNNVDPARPGIPEDEEVGTIRKAVNRTRMPAYVLTKTSFGYGRELEYITTPYIEDDDELVICGVYADQDVISCALLLRSVFPDNRVSVRSDLCAGTTGPNLEAALSVMSSCGISVCSIGMTHVLRDVLRRLRFVQCEGDSWSRGLDKVVLHPDRLDMSTLGNPMITGWRYEDIITRDDCILIRDKDHEEIIITKEKER